MFRILVTDPLPKDILSKYNSVENIEVHNKAGIASEELIGIIREYEGLAVRSRTKVTAEILEHAHRLKVIGRAGAGVDNIDVREATRRGIIVMNTPGGNTIAATEHTIAMMFAALRNIPQAYQSMKQEKWDRKTYMGRELAGKTVGIIGLGKIGREVARRLGSFETSLIGYDPLITTEMAQRLGVQLAEFDELLKNSDIITLHVPKMKETTNLINAKNLNLCKEGTIIINCARGGIINEGDLLASLNSGKIDAAAVDVFENEPPTSWDLIKHPNCIATPHLGASTEEAQIKVADQILQQMIKYIQTHVADHAVNFISVDEALQPLIQPYFELAYRLGIVLSRIREGRISKITIEFFGDIIELPTEPIAAHLMEGALKASPEAQDVEFINPVNAIPIAREKGVQIEITKSDHPLTSHTNLITCHYKTDKEGIKLSGTVYAKDIFRLKEFKEYIVDADLSGKMIIIENDDVPGIIGNVGTLLGDMNINIGHVSSGRMKEKKLALNIFNVEGKFPDGLKKKIMAIEHIREAILISI
jgi:D-3-phosphoglycerate dehydrogenase